MIKSCTINENYGKTALIGHRLLSHRPYSGDPVRKCSVFSDLKRMTIEEKSSDNEV